MSNIRDTDTLLVNRAGSSFQVEAQDFGNVRDSDLFLVNRNGQSFKCSKADVDNIRDDDLLLVNRAGASFQVSGAVFKEDLIGGGGDLTISRWNGTASEQSIVDGVNYSGGGLVIIKQTSAGSPEGWYFWSDPIDPQQYFDSTTSNGLTSANGQGVKSFNNDGYTIGNFGGVNAGFQQFIGYGLVPTRGFFDIQTYTGVGNHPHNLGAEPTFILTKTDGLNDWYLYHKELGQDRAFILPNTMGNFFQLEIWGTPGDMNASTFNASKNAFSGAGGTRHIAYLFADSPGKCKAGKYVGSSGEVTENLGFKPGFVLIKNGDTNSNHRIFDFQRPGESMNLNTKVMSTSDPVVTFTDTGFTLAASAGTDVNQSGNNYYYLAVAAVEGQTI